MRRDHSRPCLLQLPGAPAQAALEKRLREREESWEWAEILRGLQNLQEVEAAFQGRRFFLRSQLVGQAHKAIRAAGVAVPPTIREA